MKNPKVKKKITRLMKECTNNKSSEYKSFSQSYRESTYTYVELVAKSLLTAFVQLLSRLNLFNQLEVHSVFNRAFEHLQITFFFKID